MTIEKRKHNRTSSALYQISTSVLIAVYHKDNADFFRTALESIYEQQAVKPDEIVIVCDGPLTRELDVVIDSFSADKQDIVKVVRLNESAGLGPALKAGSLQCTGSRIFRMDADDISDPKRFEIQLKYLLQHPEVDVLGGNIAEFSNSPEEEHMTIRACPQEEEEIHSFMKTRNPMNHVSVCIRRQALLDGGNYRELKGVEDYELWVRMIYRGYHFANIPETLVYVRVGNGMYARRGMHEVVKNRNHLQDIMCSYGMIDHKAAFMHKCMFTVFANLPVQMKKGIYRSLLRKRK